MKTLTYATSACQFCRYYQIQGRRGGMCQQLGVPVKAGWKACSLALPPFAPSWESLEEIWQNDKLILKEELATNCSHGCSNVKFSAQKHTSTPESLMHDMLLA